ncbi:MAG: MazG-related protein [Parcubacteria group bacterium]|nr:MazG-related protein [Parcubacteria group bacterium]
MLTEIQKEILRFVTQTLTEEDIEFQASGGLAAIAYGARRPLFDIDLEIYKKDAEKVQALFKEFITEDWNNDLEGPEDEFDLWILKLEIRGVPLDINQMEDSRIKSKIGEWVTQPDIMEYEMRMIEGIELPVQRKESLIAYKKLIARDTDLIDVEQIGD